MIHTIKLKIDDSIYSHIMFFLKNLNSKKLEIVEDKSVEHTDIEKMDGVDEINTFSNHTANLINEWKDSKEDEVWN